METSKWEKIVCVLCLSVLGAFAIGIGLRLFTGEVLIGRFHMDNAFTRAVMYGTSDLGGATAMDLEDVVDINAQFVFREDGNGNLSGENPEDQGSTAVDLLRRSLEKYTSDRLPGYRFLTRMARRYEDLLRWNFVTYSEYNGVLQLQDGYLTGVSVRQNVTQQAEAVIAFREYCLEQGIGFLYAQAPHKICRIQDRNLSGTVDFTNQNADDMVAKLSAAGVDVLDIRECMHDTGMSHHSFFYRTDHHWRAENGLWAARLLLEEIHARWAYDFDLSHMSSEYFRQEDYPEYFLGSFGKKVTLERTTPDDFVMMYPTFPVNFHYEIPGKKLDLTGDFTVTYDMAKFDPERHLELSTYHAYNYGDQALIRVENLDSENDTRILFIHDSFGDCMISFMALGTEYVDSIDLRRFKGSLQSYIEETKPDIVVVMYNSAVFTSTINTETHTDLFDFR